MAPDFITIILFIDLKGCRFCVWWRDGRLVVLSSGEKFAGESMKSLNVDRQISELCGGRSLLTLPFVSLNTQVHCGPPGRGGNGSALDSLLKGNPNMFPRSVQSRSNESRWHGWGF